MVFLGLDLGKMRDPCALAAVERIEHRRAFQTTTLDRLVVRYLERFPLGMPYTKVVERVKEIVSSDALYGNCVLAVDATGLGAPVVDMLRAARLGCDVQAIVITGGERESNGSVPKKDLMAEVQMLMESGQLTIGKLKEGPRLMRELMDIRISVGSRGRMRMGADGRGEHDDLVIAVALACWRAKRRTIGEVGHRLL